MSPSINNPFTTLAREPQPLTPGRQVLVGEEQPVYTDGQLVPFSSDLGGNVRCLFATVALASPGGATSLLAVTDATPVAVVATVDATVISVRENASGVAEFFVMRPGSGAPKNTYSGGSQYSFSARPGCFFPAGMTVGYIQLVSPGSSQFIQDEQ